MRRHLVAVAAIVALSACGSSTGGSPSGSPSTSPAPSGSITPTPTPTPSETYAVFVKDFFVGTSGYTVMLVRPDGSIAVSAHGRNRTYSNGLVDLPVVSTSRSGVYYLDGDTSVRYLTPDGNDRPAYQLPVAGSQLATFAVSPDDRRIAVTVIDYTKSAPHMRLFADDLGGGHLADLFDSNTIYEWPVGWHRGRIVLAVSPSAFVQNAGGWFMGSRGFHVVDATSAQRLVTICEALNTSTDFPTSPWGATCTSYPSRYSVVSWEGQERALLPNDPCRSSGIPSPDGSVVAVYGGKRACAGAYNDPLRLVAADGTVSTSAAVGNPVGWFDNDHLLFMEDLPAFSPPNATPPIKIVDLSTNHVSQVDAQVSAPGSTGFFAGVVPGGLG